MTGSASVCNNGIGTKVRVIGGNEVQVHKVEVRKKNGKVP